MSVCIYSGIICEGKGKDITALYLYPYTDTKCVMGSHILHSAQQNRTIICITRICSGITSGRMLDGELYAQRLQKLIYPIHMYSGITSGRVSRRLERNFHETVCRQIQIN